MLIYDAVLYVMSCVGYMFLHRHTVVVYFLLGHNNNINDDNDENKKIFHVILTIVISRINAKIHVTLVPVDNELNVPWRVHGLY